MLAALVTACGDPRDGEVAVGGAAAPEAGAATVAGRGGSDSKAASGTATAGSAGTAGEAAPGSGGRGGPDGAGGPAGSAAALPGELPGLGPRTRSRVPRETRQALVVTGEGRNSPVSRAVLYEKTGDGWLAGEPLPAHNALRGWTDDHTAGDLRSPIGVFTLSDAGGRLPDPGTKLPYHHSAAFTIGGTGFEGEPLAGSFDYVVAIDYNRRPGRTPLDPARPLGAAKGGGIWLHVDHGGPTQGCVSLRQEHMRELLRALDPERNPVVVMGDAGALRR
ncbi:MULTISPECIES: L,D-transpeptidase family protein [Streptomyces]|uniref:L,D-transpeptidase family protein n=1 Tax=Streptomyces TaxID=1883 RepID=UPI001F2061BF|nr:MULTISPECIES: L,D-transpeptidase family protein [Streptomyces]